jgi:2-octaprenyl-6-methoxyphenol hydroxylase
MDSDVIIVGGGLNGPAQALALAGAGFSVTLIDALPLSDRKDPAFDGRAYALALGSQRLFKAIGVWAGVADVAQPMYEIKVTDGRAGEGPSPWMLHFDHAELEEGPVGYMVEDRHLRPTLLDAVEHHPDITHLAGETVVEQQTQGPRASVTLASGRSLDARLLIGADGRQSGTATRAGITRIGWDYGQTAIVCAVAHEQPHNGIAHQFFMPNGPLAILPLTEGRSSIVWSEDRARAAEIMAQDDAGFLTALRPAFGSFLGDIALAGQRFTYPLNLSLAQQFVQARLALIGDAAHGIHPIAGQGLNAGLRDVAALTQVLQEARQRGEDFGSMQTLLRYQSWRRFDTNALALATDTFNRLFSNDHPMLRFARDAGLAAVNASPALRQRFMREAAGISGALPRLMQV